MTEPSELRGDVISREAAIEALVRAEVAANRSGAGELDNTRARAYSDGEAAGLHFATNLLRALSALPSVPEPPNDAERAQRILDSIDEYAMTENFIIERIVKGLTNEGTMFGTTPWEQIDSREAMNLAVGYIESREWETIETDEELSSAPTGLTRQRLDEIISDFKAEYGISEQEWRMLRVFRDAILASSGKERRSDCPAEFEHDHLKTEVFKFCPTCGTDLVVWQARQ